MKFCHEKLDPCEDFVILAFVVLTQRGTDR